MIDPRIMCDKHLLGEHGELHKFLKSWEKQVSIQGRIQNNSIEPISYKSRHDLLAREMVLRGMNHQSPIEQPDFSYLPPDHLNYKVDTRESRKLLVTRCQRCRARAYELWDQKP